MQSLQSSISFEMAKNLRAERLHERSALRDLPGAVRLVLAGLDRGVVESAIERHLALVEGWKQLAGRLGFVGESEGASGSDLPISRLCSLALRCFTR